MIGSLSLDTYFGPPPGNPKIVPILAGIALFALPLAMASVGQGGVARLAFPAGALLLGVWLCLTSPPSYVSFVLWLFLLTPLVRRYVDFIAGWQQVSPIMLAPYAVGLLCLPSCIRYCIVQNGRFALPWVIVLGCVAYGFALALLYNRPMAGGFESLRWAVPPLLAIYLLAHHQQSRAFAQAITKTFAISLPLIAVYGLVQFASPWNWDAFWMENADITSIGVPQPFEIRVFATLNSPGALAVALTSGVLFLLASRRTVLVALMAMLVVPTLLLTMQRAAFFGLTVGLTYMTLLGPSLCRRRVLMAATMAALAVTALLSVPEARELVTARVSSFGALDADESSATRMEQYRTFPERLEQDLLGKGFAWEGVFANAGDQRRVFIDSGIISTFLALGLPVGFVLFSTMMVLWLVLLQQARSTGDPVAHACAAIVTAHLAELPLGSHHIAEHGVFFWTFLGLGLASHLPRLQARTQSLAPVG